KRRIRRFFVFLIIVALLAAGALYGYARLKAEYKITYDEYTATIGSISNSLSFSGSLELVDSAVYASPAKTTVRKVYVAVGDEVKDGDKLIRLANGNTIEAEFDGRVNTLDVAPDDEVAAGDTLIQVADFGHLKINFRVDEYDIASVSVGQACRVTVTATENVYESEVSAINYISASQGNVAYYTATAYVDIPAEDGVYPGMQVTVTIPQEEADNVVVLKMDALSFDVANSAFVYVMNEEGEMDRRDVSVGVSNGNYVEITEGVADGETVYAVAKNDPYAEMQAMFSGMVGSQEIRSNRSGNYGGYGNYGSGMSGNDRNYGSQNGMPGGQPGGQP
ncbi:MAG: HlyD family efflux transporter periplasmic adaptor subunit, partial [Clostridia bacterium]|nr:HlyD family efflux transporter periplasmic adaptor subunit [Clostridia bacterium]